MEKVCQINKAPDRTPPLPNSKKVFLAGSIEMGAAENWQEKITKHIEELCTNNDLAVTIYNPRRDDWDESWTQEINNTQFFDQVSWELDHIDKSDIVIIYFDKETKSPITLLELGKVLGSNKKPVVFCPEGFYRKGNVDIVCYRQDVPVLTEMDDLLDTINERLGASKAAKKEKVEDTEDEPQEKETVKESVEDNTIILKSLFDDPLVEYTKGEENIIIVEEFENIPNSCMMGKWKFMGREVYGGICNENGESKINLKLRNPNTEEECVVEFKLQLANENSPEKIILAD